MSRIDEALKRLSSGVAAEGGERSVTAERATARAEAQLESYPQEARRQDTRPVRAPERDQARAAVTPITALRPETRRPLVSSDDELAAKLIIGDHTPSVFVEQYRRLAAAMHELHAVRGVKTLLLTSAVPREGKTLTICNLALTLSESYARRVLLIDADMRRPSVHRTLGLPNVTGLGDVLRSGRGDFPVQQVSPHLSVLTAGKADNNPMAGLTSERMEAMLKKAAADFDWVLIDSPPVGLLPDAGILAGLVDAVLFVVAAGSTPFHLVERAMSELGRDIVVGTVMNRIEAHRVPATAYYDDYYGDTRRD